MPSFIADLHVHSHLSRATSRDCTVEGLYCWAQRKGIRVVGTGDCTHPLWCAELREKLIPSTPGLYRLRPDLAAALDAEVAPACRAPVEFILSGEISSIYKRGGRTRKVHSLILLPDLDSVERLNLRLSTIGNIRSDGRPILGLDPRDLVRMTLEAHAEALFIPAHIWTPWFSMLGSMSGFESPDECFGDLVGEVFAVETGLSSDPPMNWRVSSLDRFALVSNSDLHSPANLGRNATLFHGDIDFFALRRALRSRSPAQYGGTIDLFPEEGKYHADGHRKCSVCLEPEESLQRGGLCPVCGKPLVLGVLHRVTALADRPRGVRPPTAASHEYIVPLPELLAEIVGCGATSRKVTRAYAALLARFGSELSILREVPLDALRRAEPRLLDEAIRRVRSGQVLRTPGYDGEYGTIRVFGPGEMDELRRQGVLLRPAPIAVPQPAPQAGLPTTATAATTPIYRLESAGRVQPTTRRDTLATAPLTPREQASGQLHLFGAANVLADLSPEQRQAATALPGPVLIVAGPGTGKTRTLTQRIAHLVIERGAAPASIVAVTFTNRAATELGERLHGLLGEQADGIVLGTFHALCLRWLRGGDPESAAARLIDEQQEREVLAEVTGLKAADLDRVQEQLAVARCAGAVADTAGPAGPAGWGSVLRERGLLPLDEIVPRCLAWFRDKPAARQSLGYAWICVDEFQDINPAQYQLVRELAGDGSGLCVIGDPDQSIYAFRGSDPRCFQVLRHEFPGARVFRLERNYRSSAMVVQAAAAVMAPGRTALSVSATTASPGGLPVRLHAAPSVAAEAEFIAHEIEQWLGGTAHFSLDSGRVSAGAVEGAASFGDIAILVRLKAIVPAYAEALSRLGVPLQIAGGEDPLKSAGFRTLCDTLRNGPHDLLAQPAESALAALGQELRLTSAEQQALNVMWRPTATGRATLADVRDRILLRVPGDEVQVNAERVALLTMHAAKGLEFPIVFVAGCEDGVVPYRRPNAATDEDEERRLLYVAMTRARQVLYVTHSRRRLLFGQAVEAGPSSFLAALPAEAVEIMEPRRRPPRDRGPVQLELGLG